MKQLFSEDWFNILKPILKTKYFDDVGKFLKIERQTKIIYPETNEDIFKAFKLTTFDNTRVVIVGQDPYHDGSATGLAFANYTLKSPSLKNILDEVYDNCGVYTNPNLENWARQGVLLLNMALTVERNKPLSHINMWYKFTDYVFKCLNDNKTALIFMLWGNKAGSIIDKIDSNKHYILTAGHPSPLNTKIPFRGCKHFSKANVILKSINNDEIDWS